MAKKTWTENLIEQLSRQANVGQQLLDSTSREGHYGESFRFTSDDDALAERWLAATTHTIRHVLGEHEAKKFSQKTGAVYKGRSHSLSSRVQNGLNKVSGIIAVASDHPEQLLYSEPALSSMRGSKSSEDVRSPSNNVSASSNNVFIIHGHDELNLLRLEKYLSSEFGLKITILQFKSAQGRAIIEKFEEESAKCDFAFARLSPDDQVSLPDLTYAQPRPNVIFELGWFYGRLGRSRVCILNRSETKVHSDLAGINRIDYSEDVSSIFNEIRRELAAAGIVAPSQSIKSDISTPGAHDPCH